MNRVTTFFCAGIVTLMGWLLTTQGAFAEGFAEICQNRNLPTEQIRTLKVVMYKVLATPDLNIENCQQAEAILSRKTDLNLFRYQADPYWEPLTDITPLGTLEHLESLTLADNAVESIEVVARMSKLRVLNIRRNKVRDLSPLKHLHHLRELHASYNEITDLQPLQDHLAIHILYVDHNQITSLEPIKSLKLLRWLEASSNPLVQEKIGEGLPAFLEGLLLDNNGIVDLNFDRPMQKLRHLSLYNNRLTSMPNALMLRRLEVLNLEGNLISSISGVEHMPNLRWLSLVNNNVADISLLAGSFHLKFLHVAGNEICEIPPEVALLQHEHLSPNGEWIKLQIFGSHDQSCF